jgi:hypothetical protein
LAQCKLDITHPNFRASVGDDPELHSGLAELSSKVAKDRTLSGFINQPMPKFPAYQNKIWKWDFAPEGAHSSTRKNWRLYAYAPDPKALDPVPATAFLVYPRSENPKGNPATYLAKVLKKFLTENVQIGSKEERFRHQNMIDGSIRSMCLECWETVSLSSDMADIEMAEAGHECNTVDLAADGNPVDPSI